MYLLDDVNDKIAKELLKLLNTESGGKEAYEKSRYFLLSVISEIEKFILLFLIFCIIDKIFDFFIILLATVSLRMFIGGFHCKSSIGCFTISLISFLTIMLIAMNVSLANCAFLIYTLLLIVIWKAAPIQSKYRVNYNNAQKMKFKCKAITIMFVLNMIIQVVDVKITNLILSSMLFISAEAVTKSLLVFLKHSRYEEGGQNEGKRNTQ